MELFVTIIEQRPLQSRPYTDSQGQNRVFYSKGFVLSNGIDEFYAEMVGDMARDSGEYDKNTYHTMQGYIKARSYQDKNGATRYENQIIITKMI